MKSKQDNWKDFKYEDSRYLDSIARLMASKGNGGCVSVAVYKGPCGRRPKNVDLGFLYLNILKFCFSIDYRCV